MHIISSTEKYIGNIYSEEKHAEEILFAAQK